MRGSAYGGSHLHPAFTLSCWLRQKSCRFMIPFANSNKRGINIAPATRTIALRAEDTAFNELTVSPDRLGNKRRALRGPPRHFSRTQQLDCPRSHGNEILQLLFEAKDLLNSLFFAIFAKIKGLPLTDIGRGKRKGDSPNTPGNRLTNKSFDAIYVELADSHRKLHILAMHGNGFHLLKNARFMYHIEATHTV